MPYVITLIAPSQAPILEAAAHVQKNLNCRERKPTGTALDLESDTPAAKQLMDDVRAKFAVDILCQDAAHRHKRLFIADMDATMVEEETLDELAGYVGLKDQIAAITRRAMEGELDFHAALRERVGLLKGLSATALEQTAAKMTFTKGGKQLLSALKRNNVTCILVSGGFTFFTSRVAAFLGFDENHGNILNIEDGLLTGTVGEPILDKTFKQNCLEQSAARLGIPLSATVAIGDGANDLPMLQTAGLGVGFQSKPLLRDALSNHLLFNGLDALIPVLGLTPPQVE